MTLSDGWISPPLSLSKIRLLVGSGNSYQEIFTGITTYYFPDRLCYVSCNIFYYVSCNDISCTFRAKGRDWDTEVAFLIFIMVLVTFYKSKTWSLSVDIILLVIEFIDRKYLAFISNQIHRPTSPRHPRRFRSTSGLAHPEVSSSCARSGATATSSWPWPRPP